MNGRENRRMCTFHRRFLDLEQGAREKENDQDEEKTINAIQQNSSCYQYLIRLHLLHLESER